MPKQPTVKAAPPVAPKQGPGTAVVPWQEKLAQEAAEAASSEAVASEFVSFQGGILTFNGQQIADNKLPVIILDTAYEHAFYGDMVDGKPVHWTYDPDNPRSPSCYAYGRVESELAPIQEGDDAPEAPVHTDCATCPLNEWGSDPEGGKGKACKNVRRVTLMAADVLNSGNPEAVKAATSVFAKTPVTSGKFLSAFVLQVANVTKRPPWGVVALLKVERDARNQFTVKWEYVDNIPDGFIPAIMEKREKLGDAILFSYPKNEERDQQATPAAAPPPPQRGAPAKPLKGAAKPAGGRKY